MENYNIRIGQTFGQWTVISFSHKNKHHQKFWNCTCSCGYKSIVEQSRLINQYSTKCSTCANALRRIHLPVEIGNKYGNWIVLSEDAHNKNYVNARCKCGKIRRLWKQSLAYAKSTQCHADCSHQAAEEAALAEHAVCPRSLAELQRSCNFCNILFGQKLGNYYMSKLLNVYFKNRVGNYEFAIV